MQHRLSDPSLADGDVATRGAPARDGVMEAEGAVALEICVIGGALLRVDGREVPLRNRKARAMLAYLALTESGQEGRERLAGLFWSEFGEAKARQTLRQAVHEAKEELKAAGCDVLDSRRLEIALRPGAFRVDIQALLRDVAAGEAPEVLLRDERLADTLLAGLDDLDPAFHLWVTARRQTLHDRLIRGLEEGYRNQGRPRRARRRLAEAVLMLDPTHEEACRVVMRCAAEDGEIGAALRAYDALYRVLGDEHDMEPSVATQQLVAEVKQGLFEPPVTAVPIPSTRYLTETGHVRLPERRQGAPLPQRAVAPKPAIVVGPFVRSGVDAERAYLVEGFRLELIASLSRFREWYVVGGSFEPDPAMAVSVTYELTTTAYQAGAAISVMMVLQERPAAQAVWGDRFELRLDCWTEAQQHVVRRIAATMNVQVSIERLLRQQHLPDKTLAAHDAWLRAQMVIRDYTAANWNRAAELLAETIEREPGFSPLYSSLAQMNNVVPFVQPGLFRDPVNVKRSLALGERARELDPRDSRAALCLGWALAFSRRYGQALLHMDIACELNPNDAWTLMSTAMFHAFTGSFERARQLSDMTEEMTLSLGLSHWVYLASIRYLMGDDEGTVAAADRAQDALLTVAAWKAAALWNLGRRDEAAREAARFLANIRAAWVEGPVPTDAEIGRWLMHLYPISKPEIRRRLAEGLAAAGIPVAAFDPPG